MSPSRRARPVRWSTPAASERAPIDTDAAKGADPAISNRACFATGTLVQTLDGPRPIESLEVGAPVLCQNVTTGELEYQPVLAVHRDKPAPTLRITAGGESIVATGLQRFWKSGKGWTMARDLKAGDRLRIVGGVAKIASIETVPPEPVYNVDVAEETGLVRRGRRLPGPRFLASFPRSPSRSIANPNRRRRQRRAVAADSLHEQDGPGDRKARP